MGILAYRIAIFLSAFLLFLLQPMASKALLPAFGGSYLVWGTCMLFFQGLLLCGYAYAHLAQSRLGAARYARWHWLLLLAAFAAFPFRFGALSRLVPGGSPAQDVVRELALLVGPPFFALSTMSPILQRWLSLSDLPERENPYALYSPSNLGSLLALLCYPVAIEPLLSLAQQASLWWAGFGALFLLQLFCRPKGDDRPAPAAAPAAAVPAAERLRWLLLSAAGAAMLLAVTNVITFDIASVPFLWVLPLGVYLLSFVLVFARKAWIPGWTGEAFNWAVAVAVLLSFMGGMRLDIPAPAAIALQLLILFWVCMSCHGTLARRKPADPGHLTLYYMLLSLGGFCGSLVVTWIIPRLSDSPVEYLLSLVLAAAALGSCGAGERNGGLREPAVGGAILAASMIGLPALLGGRWHAAAQTVMVVALVPALLVIRYFKDRPGRLAVMLVVVLAASLATETLMFGTSSVLRKRNFYGIYKVYDHEGIRYLKHGTTLHGREYLDPGKAAVPLSYHHPAAPAGELLRAGFIRPDNAAMIGLGTGAMAMYFRDGQSLTIFELDPDNVPIAERHFRYLRLAAANGAKVRTVTGDGRLSLRREPDGRFGLLIIDAFSSGSIPVHLLTREAVSEYMRVLAPDGLLLLHISNRVLDLRPVVFGVARSLGLRAAARSNDGSGDPDADASVWMAVTRAPALAATLEARWGWRAAPAGEAGAAPWSDQYSNLFPLMFRKGSVPGTAP